MAPTKTVLCLLGLASDASARRHARHAEKLALSAQREKDLPDCLTISTYPGKCSIAQNPGACYSLDETEWQCWTDDQPEETKNEKTCKEVVEKDGACVFKDHGAKPLSDDELTKCKDVGFNSQCHPATDMWGACYHKKLDVWQCIPKNDQELIQRSREGDCKVTPLPDNDTIAYDDVCIIPSTAHMVYKCDDVPTYKKGVPAYSCKQDDIAFACFSLREEVTWQCLTSETMSVPSCVSTQIPEGEQLVKGEAYDGVCVHATSDLYMSAQSAAELAIRMPPTTTTTSTTTTTTATTTTAKAATMTTTQAGCTDTAGWTRISEGTSQDCAFWADNYCKNGVADYPGEAYNYPERHCCACGKQAATTTPNSEATMSHINNGLFLVVSLLSTVFSM